MKKLGLILMFCARLAQAQLTAVPNSSFPVFRTNMNNSLNEGVNRNINYTNPTWITSLDWSKITNTPTLGLGTVTSFSSGNLSPYFTTSVTNPTVTPALSFTASAFAADNILGNFTAGAAVPSTQAIPSCANDGLHALVYVTHILTCVALTTGGAGTLTNITWTGGIVSIANPTTTPALTIAGTSGGIPYFSSASTWVSSGVLGANLPIFGGGAGSAPVAGTKSGNTNVVVTTTGAQTNGRCVEIDPSGNHIASAGPCGGGGTVTSFSSGNLSPLFTTNVTNPTTAPALGFTLSNFAADNILGNFTGGSAAPTTQGIPVCANDGSHALVYVSHTLTCGTISAASPNSVFDGSYAKTQATFTATPSLDLANISGFKSPVRFEMATLTGNVTSVTFNNIPSSGAATFDVVWKQDGTGSRTVAYGITVVGTCDIDPTAGITTVQHMQVTSITTFQGLGCTTDHTGAEGGPETSAPATPSSGTWWRYTDSTTHVPSYKTQLGTFTSVLSGVDINGATGQVTATHLSSPLPLAQGGTNCAAPFPVLPKTSTYTILKADFTCFTTISVASGTFTLTLPASGGTIPTSGTWVRGLNYGSGVVTVAIGSGTTINGSSTSLTVAAASNAQTPTGFWCSSDGTNYFCQTFTQGGGGGSTINTKFWFPYGYPGFTSDQSVAVSPGTANGGIRMPLVIQNSQAFTNIYSKLYVADSGKDFSYAIYSDDMTTKLCETTPHSATTANTFAVAWSSTCTLAVGTYYLVTTSDSNATAKLGIYYNTTQPQVESVATDAKGALIGYASTNCVSTGSGGSLAFNSSLASCTWTYSSIVTPIVVALGQ